MQVDECALPSLSSFLTFTIVFIIVVVMRDGSVIVPACGSRRVTALRSAAFTDRCDGHEWIICLDKIMRLA